MTRPMTKREEDTLLAMWRLREHERVFVEDEWQKDVHAALEAEALVVVERDPRKPWWTSSLTSRGHWLAASIAVVHDDDRKNREARAAVLEAEERRKKAIVARQRAAAVLDEERANAGQMSLLFPTGPRAAKGAPTMDLHFPWTRAEFCQHKDDRSGGGTWAVVDSAGGLVCEVPAASRDDPFGRALAAFIANAASAIGSGSSASRADYQASARALLEQTKRAVASSPSTTP